MLKAIDVSRLFSCIVFKTLLDLKHKKVIGTVVLYFLYLTYIKPKINIHSIFHILEMFTATLPINNSYFDAFS